MNSGTKSSTIFRCCICYSGNNIDADVSPDCHWSISVQLIPNSRTKIFNNGAKMCNNSVKICENRRILLNRSANFISKTNQHGGRNLRAIRSNLAGVFLTKWSNLNKMSQDWDVLPTLHVFI